MFFSYGQTALVTYKMQDSATGVEYSFEEKDIILKANGKNVYMVTDLMTAIENKEAGDTVKFLIRRAGEQKEILVKLKSSTKFVSVEDAKTLYDALGIYYETDSETGGMVNGGLYQTGIKFGFFQTIGRSVDYSLKLAASIFTVLKQLTRCSKGSSGSRSSEKSYCHPGLAEWRRCCIRWPKRERKAR